MLTALMLFSFSARADDFCSLNDLVTKSALDKVRERVQYSAFVMDGTDYLRGKVTIRPFNNNGLLFGQNEPMMELSPTLEGVEPDVVVGGVSFTYGEVVENLKSITVDKHGFVSRYDYWRIYTYVDTDGRLREKYTVQAYSCEDAREDVAAMITAMFVEIYRISSQIQSIQSTNP